MDQFQFDFPNFMSRRQFFTWMAGLGGGILLGNLLPACRSKETEQASQAQPGEVRKLVIATAVDLYTIDPAIGFDTAIASTLKGLYDALFRHVGNPPRTIPWLVDRYETSKDARVWTFKLFENITFHDGTPLTAEAVAYSAERLLKIDKGPASLFSGILKPGSMKAINRYTVRMTLIRPFGAFLDTLPWLFIVNPGLVSAHAGQDHGQTWLKDHEAGSGPFTIAEWKPGEKYVFQAKSDYWKGWPDKTHHLLRYERRVIKEGADRVKALETHEADLADWILPGEQKRLEEKGFLILKEPSIETYEIKMNNKVGYTANIHVRKAIAYAFDYEALLQLWEGRAVLADGPLPPGLGCARKDLNMYQQNMEKAQAELARSPWPQGSFSLDYVYVAGLEEERKTGEIIRDQLARLKIKVHLIPMAWADAVNSFKNPKTAPALFPLYSSTAYADPDNYFWSGYHSSQAGEWTNPGHYASKAMDRLLEKARTILNAKERKKFYCLAQKKAIEDAGTLFGISALDHHVFGKRIRDLAYCPVTGSDEDFYFLSLSE